MLPLTKQSLDEAPYKLSRAIAKLEGITFLSLVFSWIRLNLGFLLREKLAAVLIIPSSWGSQLDSEKPSTPCCIKTFFWRRCWGKRRLLQGQNFSSRKLLDSAAGGTFMSLTLGTATKLLDNMMVNYSEWHTDGAVLMWEILLLQSLVTVPENL
jgi:hypothetical protein